MPRRFRTDAHDHPILIPVLLGIVVAMILVAGMMLIQQG
jgi:hypothetical protein